MQRNAADVTVVHCHLEGEIARLLEGDAGEAEDDVRPDGAPGDAVGHVQGALGLEELSAIGVDEPHLELVGTLFGKVGASAEDEDHGRMPAGKLAGPDGVEDAQYVELPLLTHVCGVRDDGEVNFHEPRPI